LHVQFSISRRAKMGESKMETELTLRDLMRDRKEEVVKIALAARKAVLKAAGCNRQSAGLIWAFAESG
jgi:dihydroxyacid dehydratase/phosphogluconate dehydratase